MDLDQILGQYDYPLSQDRIALRPASPRDSSKLLVHDRISKETQWSTFRHIGEFLPPRCLLILNETKVLPARLQLMRTTGGIVQALVLGSTGEGIRALCTRRLRDGEILTLSRSRTFTVHAHTEKEWMLRPRFPLRDLNRLLLHYGSMPLPPYMKHSPLSRAEQRRSYQSIFAKTPGSIAAPTASLHFTKRVFADLAKREIGTKTVTLHVHLGTFAPLTDVQWKAGKLHRETYAIPRATASAIAQAKKEGRAIIAVGTTALRALESAAEASGALSHLSGETDLFIREGYRFRVVDGLITNFHVPRSSLLMLVSAFAGRETVLDLYHQALLQDMRFLSFGDAMLIL